MTDVLAGTNGLDGPTSKAVPPAGLDPTIAVEAQLGILLSRIRAQLRDRAAFVHPDLQPAGYLILAMLVRQGPSHGRHLVSALGMDKSSVSRQVTALETWGLLERTVDPTDKRAHFLRASAKAHEAIARIRSEHRLALYDRLRHWPPGDAEKLVELLSRLNETTQ